MDRYLGPLPQMLIGMAMVVVLYEQERRTVQENSLFFSTLDVDNSRLVSATDVIGGIRKNPPPDHEPGARPARRNFRRRRMAFGRFPMSPSDSHRSLPTICTLRD